LNLFNTLSERLEPFQPPDETVKLYVCGITPYDTTHLGHAFTYTVFDILVRYLEFRGQAVTYLQNVTDIDDDILRKAAQQGEDWRQLGNRWTRHFIQDMEALNVRPPDFYVPATAVVPEIITFVGRLLESGVAYEQGGSVYYHVDAWPEYGVLSHLTKEKMLPVANERGNTPDDPRKRDPLDFVLWQAQAPGEPAWDSPWGPGRPGWHIECSTLIYSYLGESIDVHSGGSDLIFPHHESEIAQMEPVTNNHPFVRHWMHVGMVRHEGEKMSKSLGNLVMVRDLLRSWSPDTLRLYLGCHHYREAWSHDETEMETAGRLAEKLTAAINAEGGSGLALDIGRFEKDFIQALDMDLDTPAALQILNRLAGEILAAAGQGQDISAAQLRLRELGQVFGLRLDAGQAEPRVIKGWEQHALQFEA
jgi:L-cysteine:1D-myo-inositol 2-amino-2-deoxy-alpha-D-glucopyranoside ligase